MSMNAKLYGQAWWPPFNPEFVPVWMGVPDAPVPFLEDAVTYILLYTHDDGRQEWWQIKRGCLYGPDLDPTGDFDSWTDLTEPEPITPPDLDMWEEPWPVPDHAFHDPDYDAIRPPDTLLLYLLEEFKPAGAPLPPSRMLAPRPQEVAGLIDRFGPEVVKLKCVLDVVMAKLSEPTDWDEPDNEQGD